MQQRGERTRVHHEFCGRTVDRAVHIQIEAFTDLDRHGLKSPAIETWHAAGDIWISFQKEQTLLTIEHSFCRKKNIGAENAVDLLLFEQVRGSGGISKINKDDWLIDQLEATESKLAHDAHAVECAIDLHARRKGRVRSDARDSKVFAPMHSNRAYRRAGVHSEPGGFAVDKGAN